jgi:hypothetical protein
MADIYIINSENPKDIALELQQSDSKNNYVVLNSKSPKAILMELEELKTNRRIHAELKRKTDEAEKEKRIKPWRDFLYQKAFEPNKLSNKEIENLCLEFYEKFILTNNRRLKNYPKAPNINIIEELKWWFPNKLWEPAPRGGYRCLVGRYLNKIDKEIRTEIPYYRPYGLPYQDPLPRRYGALINRNNNFGGIIQYGKEYERLYYINFEGCRLSEESRIFWDWYQKTFDVIAMYYGKDTNTCHVIKKPDEWKIEDNYTKMYYRYGEKERFFFERIEVPKWLYVTPAEELNPQDYLLLQNADVKAEFVRKIGVDRLVVFGTVVDTYENYPDNEMWAKSEYKIIDMHEIIPSRRKRDLDGIDRGIAERFSYAPFLYMKNQTTGVYHLEGIHPRCKTLYDAIKMRYNGLNIKNYDIKDIK